MTVEPASPTARRLVLVHGFTQTRRCWAPVDALLADCVGDSGDVVCVDAPGHGDAADIAWDLQTAGVSYAEAFGPAVWVGYSMGGRLALHAAALRPDMVTALVLVGASPGLADPTARAARQQADETLAADVEQLGVEAFVDRWLTQPLFAGLDATTSHRAERLANTAAGLASSLRLAGTGAQESLWGRLADITCPTLVVTGANDTKFGAIADDMVTAFGGPARHVTIAGAGHSVHLEQPEAFTDTVCGWLTSLPHHTDPQAAGQAGPPAGPPAGSPGDPQAGPDADPQAGTP